MNAITLNKRLRSLETDGIRRISTLADFVVWMADGQPDPVEFDPWFEDAFRAAMSRREASDTSPSAASRR